MQRTGQAFNLAFLGLALACTAHAYAQAVPTATAPVHFSAFGGMTGAYTGIELGKNLGITAGLDVTFRSVFSLYPSAEIRGTYPVDKGSVAGERNLLGGLVLARHLGRLEPYGDILYGRGQIDYITPLPNTAGTILFVQTASSVLSPGAGCNIRLTPHFAVKGDFQFQKYQTPVTANGSAYAKAFTAAVVYNFGLGGLGHRR